MDSGKFVPEPGKPGMGIQWIAFLALARFMGIVWAYPPNVKALRRRAGNLIADYLEFELGILDEKGGAFSDRIPKVEREQLWRLEYFGEFARRQLRTYARNIIRKLPSEERQQVGRELLRIRTRIKEVNRDKGIKLTEMIHHD
jgi:hypothetical protein